MACSFRSFIGGIVFRGEEHSPGHRVDLGIHDRRPLHPHGHGEESGVLGHIWSHAVRIQLVVIRPVVDASPGRVFSAFGAIRRGARNLGGELRCGIRLSCRSHRKVAGVDVMEQVVVQPLHGCYDPSGAPCRHRNGTCRASAADPGALARICFTSRQAGRWFGMPFVRSGRAGHGRPL